MSCFSWWFWKLGIFRHPDSTLKLPLRQIYWHFVPVAMIPTHILKYPDSLDTWKQNYDVWDPVSHCTDLNSGCDWYIFGTLNRTSQKVRLSHRLPLICTSINEYPMTLESIKNLSSDRISNILFGLQKYKYIFIRVFMDRVMQIQDETI